MARAESGGDGEEEVVSRTNLSIPRGGPIYTSNLMSPLTRVPIFESDILREIQSLEAELAADCSPSSTTDDDVSVDDIKIFTDEELVEMAIKEAFRDEQNNGGCSNPCGENLNAGTEYDVSEREGSQRTNYKGTSIKRASRKGKKRKMDKHADDSYLVKVNELLKVKQKQDQDRAAAGLHSLSCKINEGVSSSSEKAEMLKSLRSTNSRTQLVKPSEIQDVVAVQLPEVVLCVEVYHNIRKYIKSQEFLVLGRQLLTEMRDKIYCVTDQVMQRAGQHDPSGYFLLEDVFYNDLRDPSAIDYSEPIFDWLRNSKDDALKKWETCTRGKLRKNQREVLGDIKISELPQFRRADMHKTRFCDLRFRLGAGYLYCHQGDCNHRIVIRDMRLIHPEDVHDRAAYPIVVFQLKYRAEKCAVCKIYRATKMTVDDKWTPSNPCYFCNDCYYLLHHAQDGSLLYSDFLVYDYVHD